MADVARVRDLQAVGPRRIDEVEGVTTDVHVGDRLFDLRHVAGDALASWAAELVVRVFLDRVRVRPILRVRSVAREAHLIGRRTQLRLVGRAVDVVATEAGDAPVVHQALDEVVALHAVFVGGAVREVGERGFTQFVLFQFPEIGEVRVPCGIRPASHSTCR